MRRRVVITGMGAVTPLGNSVREFYENQIAGRSGIRRVTRFPVHSLTTQVAAEVPFLDFNSLLPDLEAWQLTGSTGRYGAAAALQALRDAGVYGNSQIDRSRCGLYIGAGEGEQDFEILMWFMARAMDHTPGRIDAVRFGEFGMRYNNFPRDRAHEIGAIPGLLANTFELEGPNGSCLTACAAGSQAIGEACEQIRMNDADVMLCGGTHSMIYPFGFIGFCLLTAMSTTTDTPTRASCPFDRRRNGFVMGEGAGMLVLEELEHAKRRGAAIYVEITGYGVTADAFRLTDSHPEGLGAANCMVDALKDAGLNPTDIGYINAHGTSTQVNDRSETLAIKRVFGRDAWTTPISSTKSMTGHLIAGAGAVETITCVQALRNGILPPTINLDEPDPDCDLDYIPHQAREKPVRHVLTNSFGFGGQNVCLILSQFG